MKNKPNILWICTDQQRFDTLGCYGNEIVDTPHIDQLAEDGVLFEHCYGQSPICTPSRASFLTGRYPRTTRCRQNGQSIPSDEVLVTKILADQGYTCGLSGKLHISAVGGGHAIEPRIDDGYSEFHWSHSTNCHPDHNEYVQWLKSEGQQYRPVPVRDSKYVKISSLEPEYHQTAWCADKAVEFIEKHAGKNDPWLFSVNIFDPHSPFDPPEAYLNKYLEKWDQLPLPKYTKGELDHKPSLQTKDSKGAFGIPGNFDFEQMPEDEHRLLCASYWAMTDLIDVQVGKMLDALKRTGQLENTIVIFMSDHGEMLGDHGIYLKGPYFYDEGIRVPMIISWPGVIEAGRRSDAMIELVDLAPTLLEAAEVSRYEGMQGKSFWPLLNGTADVNRYRENVYCEFYNANAHHKDPKAYLTMFRNKDYKLVAVHGMDAGELYDLNKDPDETWNRWHDSDYAEIKSRLLKQLCDRMAETVDPLPARTSKW
jgi:arylsulfatase